MFTRPAFYQGGLQQKGGPGFGWLAGLTAAAETANADTTITAAKIGGGLVLRSGATVGRTDTSDTATNLLLDSRIASMDVGESFVVAYSNQSTQTITIAGAAGVTASGNLAIPTLTVKFLVYTRTGASAFTLVAL